MKKYRYIYITCLFIISLSSTVKADDISSNEITYYQPQPSAENIILDGLVYRPLSIAGTLLGAGIYILTLPFSLIGGNVEQAGEALVGEPAELAFDRCLGCLPDYHYREYHYQD